eukprot:scaffold29188_cov16-Prasinocladus_malaysianus.AAC.1
MWAAIWARLDLDVRRTSNVYPYEDPCLVWVRTLHEFELAPQYRRIGDAGRTVTTLYLLHDGHAGLRSWPESSSSTAATRHNRQTTGGQRVSLALARHQSTLTKGDACAKGGIFSMT